MSARCTDTEIQAGKPVTVAARPRKSKVGKWRALALVLVHVAIALHIAHWMTSGETMSPLEPSEAMRLSKESVVNAGAVFFALAILSTLLLGRWFCGWACHLVAVQDLCSWILGKIGVKPRHVNLGALAVVPWIAFVYMFVTPLIARWSEGASLALRAPEMTTNAFWRTFPNWPVAVATVLVCGFVIIYVLGAKGFCNYGCPYGAIFGIADQLAPVRVRVTDACRSCGQCTRVCTSGVDVAREVRTYGAVVDPRCMKCLDCVSACPSDALYVGAGLPAILTKLRTPGDAAQATPPRPSTGAWPRRLHVTLFTIACMAVFLAHEGVLQSYVVTFEFAFFAKIVLWSALVTLPFALVVRGKARTKHDASLGEEIALSILFLIGMLGFRGLEEHVPFLFALGVAALFSFGVLHAYRLVRRSDLALQNWTLKAGGRLTRAGATFGAVMLAVLALFVAAGATQIELRERGRVTGGSLRLEEGVRAFEAHRLDEAQRAIERALALDPSNVEAARMLLVTLCTAKRFPEAREASARLLTTHASDSHLLALAARAAFECADHAAAQAHIARALGNSSIPEDALGALAQLQDELGDAAGASATRARGRP